MFSVQISEKRPKMSYFVKIRPVGTKLPHAHGQTGAHSDVTKLEVALRNFAQSAQK